MRTPKCLRSLLLVWGVFLGLPQIQGPRRASQHTSPRPQRKATLLTKPGVQRWSRVPPYLGLLQAGSVALPLAWSRRARYPLPSLLSQTRPLMRKASVAGLSQQPASALSSQGSAHYQSSNPSRSHGNHRSFLSEAEEKEGRGGATVKRTVYFVTSRPEVGASDHHFRPIHSRLQILKEELRRFRSLLG